MIVAHINRDMAVAVMDAVVAMVRRDAEAGGAKIPLRHDAPITEWTKLRESIQPTTQAWIDCLGEFGYRFHLDTMRFVRPV